MALETSRFEWKNLTPRIFEGVKSLGRTSCCGVDFHTAAVACTQSRGIRRYWSCEGPDFLLQGKFHFCRRRRTVLCSVACWRRRRRRRRQSSPLRTHDRPDTFDCFFSPLCAHLSRREAIKTLRIPDAFFLLYIHTFKHGIFYCAEPAGLRVRVQVYTKKNHLGWVARIKFIKISYNT